MKKNKETKINSNKKKEINQTNTKNINKEIKTTVKISSFSKLSLMQKLSLNTNREMKKITDHPMTTTIKAHKNTKNNGKKMKRITKIQRKIVIV